MDRGRVVSGDYRGFVMIWDMEDIAKEMRQFEKNQKKKVELFFYILKAQHTASALATTECDSWHLSDGGSPGGEDRGRRLRGDAAQLPPGAQGQRDRPLPRRCIRPGVRLQRQKRQYTSLFKFCVAKNCREKILPLVHSAQTPKK